MVPCVLYAWNRDTDRKTVATAYATNSVDYPIGAFVTLEHAHTFSKSRHSTPALTSAAVISRITIDLSFCRSMVYACP
jgi:hypothetical protein